MCCAEGFQLTIINSGFYFSTPKYAGNWFPEVVEWARGRVTLNYIRKIMHKRHKCHNSANCTQEKAKKNNKRKHHPYKYQLWLPKLFFSSGFPRLSPVVLSDASDSEAWSFATFSEGLPDSGNPAFCLLKGCQILATLHSVFWRVARFWQPCILILHCRIESRPCHPQIVTPARLDFTTMNHCQLTQGASSLLKIFMPHSSNIFGSSSALCTDGGGSQGRA